MNMKLLTIPAIALVGGGVALGLILANQSANATPAPSKTIVVQRVDDATTPATQTVDPVPSAASVTVVSTPAPVVTTEAPVSEPSTSPQVATPAKSTYV